MEKTIDQLALEYRALKNKEDEIKEQLDTTKALLIAEMDARKADKVVTADGFKVSYTCRETTRLDNKRLQAERPDIYTAYSSTSISPVLYVR